MSARLVVAFFGVFTAADLYSSGATATYDGIGVAQLLVAQATEDQTYSSVLARAYKAVAAGNLNEAIQAAAKARELNRSAEEPTRILVDALSRLGRKKEALAEADRQIEQAGASAALLAQRGYLRQQLNDPAGAIADFQAALAKGGMEAEQSSRISTALEEAKFTKASSQAYKSLSAKDWTTALRAGREAHALHPGEEGPVRVIIEALSQLGRKREALKEANRLIAKGGASGLVYAQRGYLRREQEDFKGAASDFDNALRKGGLELGQIGRLRFARAEARSQVAEAAGNLDAAAGFLRDYLGTAPKDANAWFTLGYLYSRHQQSALAGEAFETGLQIERRGDILLEAGFAFLRSDARRASTYLREAVDAWDSDPRLRSRSKRELDTVRNQIVEADASIRTTLAFGGFLNRPLPSGGRQAEVGAETAVRFDGRYLPAVAGLEAYGRGYWSRDQNRFTESLAALGIRWRPFSSINFVVGAEAWHKFDPVSLNELVLIWGYSIGGLSYSLGSVGLTTATSTSQVGYPYDQGWKPLWSFATFGSYRTSEQRYLQDLSGQLGYAYWSNSALPMVIGPVVLAVASYDSAAINQWAAGIGPAIVSRYWLGGGRYRAYDAILTLQLGYLFAITKEKRQSGPQVKVGFIF